jgi:hypothetical protein
MPRGPKGEKRPADVIGNAVHVMRIATGEIEDTPSKAPARAKGGKVSGRQRPVQESYSCRRLNSETLSAPKVASGAPIPIARLNAVAKPLAYAP